MHGKLKKEGDFELFETTNGHQILTLDQEEWFAVVETSQGHLLVKSDSDHEKDKTVDKGQYYIADFEADPEFKDMPHLFLKDTKTKYREFVLPRGLPTEDDDRKKVIVVDEEVKADKVESPMKGLGDKSSEKQYHQNDGKSKGGGANEQLSDMTKGELYKKAKEEDLPGRSNMNKEELRKNLQ